MILNQVGKTSSSLSG